MDHLRELDEAAINATLPRLFCMMWRGGCASNYKGDSDGISSGMYKHYVPGIVLGLSPQLKGETRFLEC